MVRIFFGAADGESPVAQPSRVSPWLLAGLLYFGSGIGLAEARRKSTERVYYARAAAETLPLPGEFADMIFMSMVFHHFDDPEQAVRECRRVLRHDGSVCLRAGTTDRINQTPYLPFFPRSCAILHNTFHSQAAIEAIFNDYGFQLVGHELVRQEVAKNWKAYADKLAFRADSILVQLSDQEFEEGLAAARQYAAAAPPAESVNELVFLRLAPPTSDGGNSLLYCGSGEVR